MAKPVGAACNMRCAYCYYLKTQDQIPRSASFCMSAEHLESFIRSYISESPGPVVSFVWHGGEPTLAGLDFYRRAVSLQEKYLPEGFSVWNNLQTNGLLLDDEWCRFLSENHFDVGISIDGNQLCHDANRPDAAGAPTYERTAEAIHRLGRAGIRPDLLCTVNSLTAPNAKAVYESLRSFETGWIQFIPVIVPSEKAPSGLSSESVTADGYGQFLIDVFDEWLYHDLGKTDVQLFSEIAHLLASQGKSAAPSLCWMKETCGNVLIVEKEGQVYSCDHFVNEAHHLGTMGEGFQKLLSSDFQQSFGRFKKTALTKECQSCPYLSFCHGACPKDRFGRSKDGEEGQYILCPGLKRFFAYALPLLGRAMALTRSLGSPTLAMEALKKEEKLRFSSMSRNDLCPCGSGKKVKHCHGRMKYI